MLEGVYLSDPIFVAHAVALFRAWPIRQVGLESLARDRVSTGAAFPWLSRLTLLLVNGDLAAGGVAELAASPHLANLRKLALIDARAGPEGTADLTRSPLGRLEALCLDGNGIGAAGAESLAGWERLSGVTQLDLSRNGIGSVGLEAICASERSEGLRELTIQHDSIAAPGTRAIAQTERLRGLEVLRLDYNPLGEEGIEQLALSANLRCLRELSLDGTRCGRGGARALAASPIADSLTRLQLSTNNLGPEGAAALARSSHLLSLTQLDLSASSHRRCRRTRTGRLAEPE